MICPLRLPKYSSPFLRDHVGLTPPPFEICHLPPGPGNGRTYTSSCPVSFDEYASHLPSGENIGSCSANGVFKNTAGFPGFHPDASSPSIGRIIKSEFVWGLCSSKARNLPLGCQEAGRCAFLLSVRRCSSPVPSARRQ